MPDLIDLLEEADNAAWGWAQAKFLKGEAVYQERAAWVHATEVESHAYVRYNTARKALRDALVEATR